MRILPKLPAVGRQQRVNAGKVMVRWVSALVCLASVTGWAQLLPGEFVFTAGDYPVSETDAAVITVTRINGTDGKLLVDYGTSNGTATNGVDYTGTTNTLVFNDFQTSASFTIPIIDNVLSNANKKVNLRLFNPRPAPGEDPALKAALGKQTNATITIFDDDAELSFNFERMYFQVGENDGEVKIKVVLPKPPGRNGRDIAIDYRTVADGSFSQRAGSDYATEDADFTSTSGTLTFDAETFERTITIPILTDSLVEFNEDFKVILENPKGGVASMTTVVDTSVDPPTTNAVEVVTPYELGRVKAALVTILFNGSPADPQPAGAVDQTFNPDNDPTTVPPLNSTPGANNTVYAVAVQPDGKTVLGGDFSAVNAVTRSRIARVETNGVLDVSFRPPTGANDFVSSLAVYDSGTNRGKIVMGGGFTAVNGLQRNSVARLNDDGSLDARFNPGEGANGRIYALALQGDGKVVVGGEFTTFDRVPRNRIARLNENGSLDLGFDPGAGANGSVYALAMERPTVLVVESGNTGFGSAEHRTNITTGATSGIMEITYDFAMVSDSLRVYYENRLIFDTGLTNNLIVVSNSDGTITTNFSPATVTVPYGPGTATDVTIVINEGSGDIGTVWSYSAIIRLTQTTGILVGGDFDFFDNFELNRIARLNPNGSLDRNYGTGTGADGSVQTIALASDGKVLLGGAFNTLNSLPRKGIGRLNTDGSVDMDFHIGSGADGMVFSIAVQPDNRILIGGTFNAVNTTRRVNVARLLPGGPVDTSFMDTAYNQFAGLPNPDGFAPNGFVSALAFNTNGDVVVGGRFTRVGGGPTRADIKPRYNYARMVGGATPGPGNLQFMARNFGVDENGGVMSVPVSRTNGRLGAAALAALTFEGVALDQLDFVSTNSILLWPSAGPMVSDGDATNKLFSIRILDDNLIEGDETFNLELLFPVGSLVLGGERIPAGAALGNAAEARGVIVDNDFSTGELSFSAPAYSVNEDAGTVTINVVRTGSSSGFISVQYATLDGTATNGVDYIGASGFLSFAPGQTNKSFLITIRDDSIVEEDETVILKLSNPSGGATLGTNSTVIMTLVDNDFAPGRVSFVSTNFVVSESAASALVSVKRAGGSVGVLSVQYATSDGTAAAPFDYNETAGTLTWDSEDTLIKTFAVPIHNDGWVEGDEKFNVILANPSVPGALAANQSTATVTLADDDFYGKLSFNAMAYLADENGTNVAIKVIRRDGSSESVSVDYDTRPGTAAPCTNGLMQVCDYQDASGTLTFGVGELSKTFLIPIQDDDVPDKEKTVLLKLSNPVKATLGNITNATLTLIDNESVNIPAGSLETDFGSGVGPNAAVYAVVLQPDGKMMIGGDFTVVDRQVRNRIARLKADGTLDRAFEPEIGADGAVRSLAVQGDGRIVLGGLFTSVDGRPLNALARLTPGAVLDSTFDPGAGADNTVYAIAETFVRGERKLVIGGAFNVVNGISRRSIARLNENGTVDPAFKPGSGANGLIYVVLVQRDGKLIIAGDFTMINGVNRNFVARLNEEGSLDATFDAGLSADGSVRAAALQADDKLVIGGLFTAVSGAPRNSIARLNSDGRLDADFNPGSGANGSVYALAVQIDGKIVVGGDFTSFNGVGRNRIARLNEDGTIDTTINLGTGANAFVATLAVQPDRKIIMGGGFTNVNEAARNYLARLHGGSIAGPGSLEFSAPSFAVNENATNAVVTVRRSGGTSGAVSVDYRSSPDSADPVADYLDVAGTLFFLPAETSKTFNVPIIDDNFAETNETINLALSNPAGGAALGRQPIAALTLISDDSVISFSEATYGVNETTPGGQAAIFVARTGESTTPVTVRYSTGSGTAAAGLDFTDVSGTLTFAPGETMKPLAVPIIDDTLVEGNETLNLRLSNPSTGAILGVANAVLTIFDDDFAPGRLSFAGEPVVNEGAGSVVITVIRVSGKTGTVSVDYAASDGTAVQDVDYVGVKGTLTFVEGEISKSFIVPIKDDNALEGNETVIMTLSNASGGAILISPSVVVLTIVEDDFGPGSLDQDFNPSGGANGVVRSVVLQPDGKILVGGDFDVLDGFSRSGIGRLNSNGSIDSGFSPGGGPDGVVLALALQPNGKLVLGGAFRQIDFLSRSWAGRLLTNGFADATFGLSAGENAEVFSVASQPDGKVVSGGAFTSPSGGILRLNRNGSLDVSFDPSIGADGPVYAVALQPDGKAVIAGRFSKLGGVGRGGLARLHPNGLLDASFASGSGANGAIYSLIVRADGQILIGGDFTLVNEANRSRVAQLKADGSNDPTFEPGTVTGPSGLTNGVVRALALQSDGKVFLAGNFTNVAGFARSRIARLNADGSLDTSFDSGRGPDDTVYALAVQPDGKVILGGAFSSVNGFSRSGIARLNGDPVVSPVPVTLNPVRLQAKSQVQISFSSQPGASYVVEASTDLRDWLSLGISTPLGPTIDVLTETDPGGSSGRFYRVRRISP